MNEINQPTPEPIFQNPYPAAGKGLTMRLNVNIGTEEFLAVKRVTPEYGITQIVMGLLFHKLHEQLKSRGLLDYQRVEEFKHFITHCAIVEGPSDLNATPGTHGPDDRRPTPVPHHPPTVSSQATSYAEIVPGRRGGRSYREEAKSLSRKSDKETGAGGAVKSGV